MRPLKTLSLALVALLGLSFGISLASDPPRPASGNRADRGWAWSARHSSGLAPDPAQHAATAIVQVYAAPTYGWRGTFAVHPWIIYKRSGQTSYTRYEVIGWGSGDSVRRDRNEPDGLWFGAMPQVLADHRGSEVDAMIDQIEAAITRYPYKDEYRSYPGPNSNTFLAFIGREVPALRLDMPANAIGKDYRPLSEVIGLSPSGTGLQLSVLGLLGLIVGVEEGVEVNLLGLNFGVDIKRPALRLPSIGRLGVDRVQAIDRAAGLEERAYFP